MTEDTLLILKAVPAIKVYAANVLPVLVFAV